MHFCHLVKRDNKFLCTSKTGSKFQRLSTKTHVQASQRCFLHQYLLCAPGQFLQSIFEYRKRKKNKHMILYEDATPPRFFPYRS